MLSGFGFHRRRGDRFRPRAIGLHPRQPQGKRLGRKRFLELGHVSIPFGHAPAIFEDWFSTRYGGIRKIEVIVQDFEVACRLVVGTHRIATVMSRMARLCADHLPLRLLTPPFAVPAVTHCHQWNRYQDHDPGSRWLRALLEEEAGRIGLKNRSAGRPPIAVNQAIKTVSIQE